MTNDEREKEILFRVHEVADECPFFPSLFFFRVLIPFFPFGFVSMVDEYDRWDGDPKIN